jgi:hypothetical protein
VSERILQPAALSDDGWAPFGWIPVPDTDPRDGTHRLVFDWSDPHVNIIGHGRAEVPSVPGGLLCQTMFRHDSHTQTLMSLDHEAVIAVAPATEQFSVPDSWGTVCGFILQPLQAIVLRQGTWHWGPFPTHAESVQLFNVQGLRYVEDNASVDLTARGLDFEVRIG